MLAKKMQRMVAMRTAFAVLNRGSAKVTALHLVAFTMWQLKSKRAYTVRFTPQGKRVECAPTPQDLIQLWDRFEVGPFESGHGIPHILKAITETYNQEAADKFRRIETHLDWAMWKDWVKETQDEINLWMLDEQS